MRFASSSFSGHIMISFLLFFYYKDKITTYEKNKIISGCFFYRNNNLILIKVKVLSFKESIIYSGTNYILSQYSSLDEFDQVYLYLEFVHK